MIEQVKNVDDKLLPELFKRLSEFVDVNHLKQDFINLLSDVSKLHGFQAIEKSILPMSNQQLEQLKDSIPEVNEILAFRQAERERKREIMKEEKKRIDVEPARNINKSRKSNTNDQNDAKFKCEFCGHYDSKFSDEDEKDLHYLENCPKLTSCPGCDQIIEKSVVNTHLVNECENKAEYSQCKE